MTDIEVLQEAQGISFAKRHSVEKRKIWVRRCPGCGTFIEKANGHCHTCFNDINDGWEQIEVALDRIFFAKEHSVRKGET